MDTELPLDDGLFGRLRRDCGTEWDRYVAHPFLLALGAGTLSKRAFQHYLRQDYLFLIQFARAYALAGYKSADMRDLRAASAAVTAIVDVEMPVHIAYCREWGISEADMEAEPEAMETIAYTRFVLERGLAGDRLDLEAALAPCVVGYAEAVQRLKAHPGTVLAGNPYAAWIDTYAGAEYRAVAASCIANLNRLGDERGGEARYAGLLATFTTAARLEAAFWEMGLAAS